MKRFLVCIYGEEDKYQGAYIVGEFSKPGEIDMCVMIDAATHNTGVWVSYRGSSVRSVYKFIHASNRKDVLNEDKMKLLYAASIQKYNESNNA